MPLPEAPAGRPRLLLHRTLQARVRQGREDLRELLQRRVRQAAGGCTEGNSLTSFSHINMGAWLAGGMRGRVSLQRWRGSRVRLPRDLPPRVR